VVDAALDAGVGRVVQESVVMLYPDGGAGWIDEDVPAEAFPIARGNLAAEASAHRFTEAGTTDDPRVGVVLRFGWFYGPPWPAPPGPARGCGGRAGSPACWGTGRRRRPGRCG
jgi:nucleoside-diphosphate-sugar epimerase